MKLFRHEHFQPDSFISRFEDLFQTHAKELCNSSILVLGAGGSIGGSVAKVCSRYLPKKLTLVDSSENYLVEVVRALRNENPNFGDRLETYCLDINGSEFCAFFEKYAGEYEYILNLAAMKHVRSDRNIYTLLRMMQTNFVSTFSILSTLEKLKASPKKFFTVSTDKASSPVNFMGLSKSLMEICAFKGWSFPVSSARFANVAYSNGSLLDSFVNRLKLLQPISYPGDVKRYFINHLEAAHLCLISVLRCKDRQFLIPNFQESDALGFEQFATSLLAKAGYTPFYCDSETEAVRRLPELEKQGKWPIFVSRSDTSGEKMIESFLSSNDRVIDSLGDQLLVVHRADYGNGAEIDHLLGSLIKVLNKAILDENNTPFLLYKDIQRLVPEFVYVDLRRSLDDKM